MSGSLSDAMNMARHSRRRVYQDQMFSLKKAGLNPILASGATPTSGFMGFQPDQGPAYAQAGASAVGAITKAAKVPAETRQLQASTSALSADARLKGEEATNAALIRGNIALEGDRVAAQTASERERSILIQKEAGLLTAKEAHEQLQISRLKAEMPGISSRAGYDMFNDPTGTAAHAIARDYKTGGDALGPTIEDVRKKAGQVATSAKDGTLDFLEDQARIIRNNLRKQRGYRIGK